MINLNSSDYNLKVIPTPELILKRVNDLSIFNYFIKNLELNTAFSSPLRKDESPSFSIFYSKKYNKFLFKDLSTGECGDCFVFLRKLYPTYKFSEILDLVCTTFNLEEYFHCTNNMKTKNMEPARIITDIEEYKKSAKTISVKYKLDSAKLINWEYHDIMFWNSYGITTTTLRLFNVYPITHIFVYDPDKNKETIIACDKYAYAFIEEKDGKTTYKIYQPYATLKWLTSHNHTIHQGYTLLPNKGELLIITKSLKDVMSLYEVAKIPAIGIQSETVLIKDTVIKEYKNRFDEVLCLFDNDIAGIALSQEYASVYNIPFIIIPGTYESKDFSDLVKHRGRNIAKQAIEYFISEKINIT